MTAWSHLTSPNSDSMTEDAPVENSGSGAYKPYSGLAIASMVCGICGIWTLGISSIVGLVLGYRARRETRQGDRRGDGMAITGIVLGWVLVAGIAGTLSCSVLLTGCTLLTFGGAAAGAG